jgi:hypothetical protein
MGGDRPPPRAHERNARATRGFTYLAPVAPAALLALAAGLAYVRLSGNLRVSVHAATISTPTTARRGRGSDSGRSSAQSAHRGVASELVECEHAAEPTDLPGMSCPPQVPQVQ